MSLPKLLRNAPREWGISLALVAAVAVCYAPVSHNGFVLLDDPEHVSENPIISQGLTWHGVVWAFTSANAGFWLPLTWLSSMLDWTLFGDWAAGHHGMNVALHAANSVILFLVMRRMTAALWASALVAAIFALHPLQVESVAWACERKNVLSTTFWFLALAAYARYAAAPSILRYLLVCLATAASLMSKQMGVTIPCVLLLLDFWPLRRVENLAAVAGFRGALGRLSIEKLPLLALSTAASVIAAATQAASGAVMGFDVLPFWGRLANALWSYARYVGMFLWPAHLTVIYSHPYVKETLTAWMVAAGAAALLLGTFGAIRAWRRSPALLVSWLWFVGTLVPVIGLVQVGNQGLADRFMYVPLVGLAMALAFALAEWTSRRPGTRTVVGATAVLVVLVLGGLSWRQVSWWRDTATLMRRSLEIDEHELAHHTLALDLLGQEQEEAAIGHLQRAVELSDTFSVAHLNLGKAYERRGEFHRAVEQYELALRDQPGLAPAQVAVFDLLRKLKVPEEDIQRLTARLPPAMSRELAHLNRGIALARQGKHREAVAEYEIVLQASPGEAGALTNLALSLIELNEIDAAIAKCQDALAASPGHAPAENAWGMALARRGHNLEAKRHYQRAIELDPRVADPHYNLGNLAQRQGQIDAAIAHYRNALRVQPALATAQLNLGVALVESGQPAEADEAFRQALDLDPKSATIQFAIAKALWDQKRYEDSLPRFRAASELSPTDALARFLYACNLAQLGALDQAKTQFLETLRLTDANSAMAAQVRENLSRIERESGT